MTKPKLNILILGASGMLGGALFSTLPKISKSYQVFGTYRDGAITPQKTTNSKLVKLDDVFEKHKIIEILQERKVDVVINAIGLIKQIDGQLTKADYIRVNSWLPHFLMEICDEVGARFIEVSTDCVFKGDTGLYTEKDNPDARDEYGLSKFLGEITDNANAVTIRTSIIGHESGRAASLIDWFLSTSGTVGGYNKAIFSGFPTVYLADIIGEYILPNRGLHGLYHVSANPINKYDLLELVAKKYRHEVELVPNESLIINRSLDSSKFQAETGFKSPSWPELIDRMNSDRPIWNRNED